MPDRTALPARPVSTWLSRLLLAAALLAIGLSQPADAAAQAASAAANPTSATQPNVTARAAVVIDASTGAILYEKNAHDRLPPASLTKMATAIVALERGTLDQPILGT